MGRACTEKSDIYSFGVCLWELVMRRVQLCILCRFSMCCDHAYVGYSSVAVLTVLCTCMHLHMLKCCPRLLLQRGAHSGSYTSAQDAAGLSRGHCRPDQQGETSGCEPCSDSCSCRRTLQVSGFNFKANCQTSSQ